MSSSRDKSKANENVFEQISAPVEFVQDYVPGGLHAVHLGDMIGRYKILRKLGYGGYSTVWLAQHNGVYFDDDGQLQKFIVDDDAFPYSDFGDLPEDDEADNEDHYTMPEDTKSDSHHHHQQPNEILSSSPRSRLGNPPEFFDPDLYPSIVTLRERKPREEEEEPTSLADFVALYPPLAKRWALEKHPDMQSAESDMVLDFLQCLLTYESDRRLSTTELLQHAWIRTYCASDAVTDSALFSEKATIAPSNKGKRSIRADESKSNETEDEKEKQ
ncbi:hypothetical protein DV736_g4278, partial [Chaetothyriales sp. CBS 134916]